MLSRRWRVEFNREKVGSTCAEALRYLATISSPPSLHPPFGLQKEQTSYQPESGRLQGWLHSFEYSDSVEVTRPGTQTCPHYESVRVTRPRGTHSVGKTSTIWSPCREARDSLACISLAVWVRGTILRPSTAKTTQPALASVCEHRGLRGKTARAQSARRARPRKNSDTTLSSPYGRHKFQRPIHDSMGGRLQGVMNRNPSEVTALFGKTNDHRIHLQNDWTNQERGRRHITT